MVLHCAICWKYSLRVPLLTPICLPRCNMCPAPQKLWNTMGCANHHPKYSFLAFLEGEISTIVSHPSQLCRSTQWYHLPTKTGIGSPNCMPMVNHTDVIWAIDIQVVNAGWRGMGFKQKFWILQNRSWISTLNSTRHSNMMTPMPFALLTPPAAPDPWCAKIRSAAKGFNESLGQS